MQIVAALAAIGVSGGGSVFAEALSDAQKGSPCFGGQEWVYGTRKISEGGILLTLRQYSIYFLFLMFIPRRTHW